MNIPRWKWISILYSVKIIVTTVKRVDSLLYSRCTFPFAHFLFVSRLATLKTDPKKDPNLSLLANFPRITLSEIKISLFRFSRSFFENEKPELCHEKILKIKIWWKKNNNVTNFVSIFEIIVITIYERFIESFHPFSTIFSPLNDRLMR